MNIEEFCTRQGDGTRKIDDVLLDWQARELARLVDVLRGAQHDDVIGSAVVVADALHGDGMLDQIPHELRDAFVNLMRERADTYDKIRQILRAAIRPEGGGFLSFDDNRVQGWISKLKGQIGENIFKQNAGDAAELAKSGSQEAWDVAVTHGDGAREYVQVKLYADPRDVIRHMLSVQEKVDHGWIQGCAGETVHQIDFAVPADIAERVNDLKDHYQQLESIRVLPIPMGAHSAAEIVKEGMSNVGPDELGHFFDELLCGALAAGSLHGLVNGFLWYKGSKEFSAAFASATASTAISTTGIGMGLFAETLCHSAMLSGAVGIGGRLFLSRVARSRWNFGDFLERSIAETERRIASLGQMCTPRPATA